MLIQLVIYYDYAHWYNQNFTYSKIGVQNIRTAAPTICLHSGMPNWKFLHSILFVFYGQL
jgi:hypothetical protein